MKMLTALTVAVAVALCSVSADNAETVTAVPIPGPERAAPATAESSAPAGYGSAASAGPAGMAEAGAGVGAFAADSRGFYPGYYPPPAMVDLTPRFMAQPVDHFDNVSAGNKTYWRMRFVEKWDQFSSGGPVYIIIFEDYEKDLNLLSNGLMAELATETHGVLFGIEQRYSGMSIPERSGNYKYLSTELLLADLANFLITVKDNTKLVQSKVLVAGTGYAGLLSSWVRQKYPRLVDVAIADVDSARLDLEDPTIRGIVDNLRKNAGEACVKDIGDKLEHQQSLLMEKNGAEKLRQEELLCPGADLTDKAQWYAYNAAVYSQLASITSSDTYTLSTLCNNVTPFSTVTDVDYCFVVPNATHWRSRINYLQCHEYGLFRTSNGTGPIPLDVPLRWHIDMCRQNYGEHIDLAFVTEGIARTNKAYRRSNATQIVYLSDKSSDAPAITLKSTNVTPYPGMLVSNWQEHDAVARVKHLVKKWLGHMQYFPIDNYSFFTRSRKQ